MLGQVKRARNDAQRRGELIWTPETHADLVRGEPAELRSKTKITAEQVLAIGLPDLTTTRLPGAPEPSRSHGRYDPRRAGGRSLGRRKSAISRAER